MEDVVIKSVSVIDLSQFKGGPAYGVTVYRGVLIVWDEDRDPRVIEAVDDLVDIPDKTETLMAVHESQGYLIAVWKDRVPASVDGRLWVQGDEWNVEHVVN